MAQRELSFSASRPAGLQAWYDQRDADRRQLSRDVGLPIGHSVECELNDGAILKGKLELAENLLWIEPGRRLDMELRIGRCSFRVRDIARCVRQDPPAKE